MAKKRPPYFRAGDDVPSEDDMSADLMPAPKPKPTPAPAPSPLPAPKPKPKPKDDAVSRTLPDDVMACGGKVKKMASGGSTRGDGCAQRGKTKGRNV